MPDVFDRMKNQRIVPVIRSRSRDGVLAMVGALAEAGLSVIELTTTIPNVFSLIVESRRLFPEIAIGLGTVRRIDQAQRAVDAGASVLITYKASESLALFGKSHGIPYILGAATPTEVDHCLEWGSPLIKWFPASVHGPQILRDLLGPIPEAQFFPTGGIALESVPNWLAAGAVAVGVGSDLLKDGRDLHELTTRTRLAIQQTKLYH